MYKAAIHEDKIYVYHHKIQEIIENELKNILYDYLVKQICYYLNTWFDLTMPEIEIKNTNHAGALVFQSKIKYLLI